MGGSARVPGIGAGPPAPRRDRVVRRFNDSAIRTVQAVIVTSNAALAEVPGNVALSPLQSGLPRASMINVSQLVTLDKRTLSTRVGELPEWLVKHVDQGLRLVLALA